MINLKINGIPVQVAEGSTVLEAAKKAHVKIPTLCFNPDLSPWAACGICVVKVEGSNKMLRSCCTPVSEGMSIITNDPELVQTRRTVIELILSTHPDDCLACSFKMRSLRSMCRSMPRNARCLGCRVLRTRRIYPYSSGSGCEARRKPLYQMWSMFSTLSGRRHL